MTRSAIRTEERRWRRGDVLAVVAAVVLGAAFAWILLSIQGMAHDLKAKDTSIAALSQQVRDLGGKPVTGPRGEAGKSVTGPKGEKGDKGDTGEPGSPGSPGPSGSPGKTGKTGDDGSNGDNGVGSPGPTGAAGSNGVPGPAGPQGDPGPAGPEGRAGQDGADGKDGQSCPDGYSWQTPSYDPYAKVCRQDGAPDPEPSKDRGLLSAGALDPTRRQYI